MVVEVTFCQIETYLDYYLKNQLWWKMNENDMNFIEYYPLFLSLSIYIYYINCDN